MKMLTKLKDNRKRIFYGSCFFALMFIDWIKNSRDGEAWTLAVNLTGIVMAAMLASCLKWKKEKALPYIIWLLFWLAGSVTAYFIWRSLPESVYVWQFISGAVNVGVLGIISLRVLRLFRAQYQAAGQNRKHKWDRKRCLPGLLWAVMSVLMAFSPYYANIWQLWFLLMFGLFYLIPIDAAERKSLLSGCMDGIIEGFFALQIYAYGFRPYDEVRYLGAFSNCNMNALFYVVTYTVLLYRIFEWHGRKEAKPWVRRLLLAFYYILAAGMISFLQFTMTRTAMLTVLGVTLVYGIIVWLVLYREKWWKMLAQWFVLGTLAVVLVPVVYLTIRYLPTVLHHPVWFGAEYSIEKVHSFDPADSDKYVSFDEFLEEAFERFPVEALGQKVLHAGALVVHAAEESTVENQVQMQELLPIDASSGAIRKQIFKLYFQNLNFIGHTLEEGQFQITETYHSWHAQNFFMQIAFFYGMPSGILCMILLVWIAVKSLKLILRRNDKEAFFTLLVWLTFMGYGLLECVWYPGQMILFLLFFSVKFLQKEAFLQE